MPVFSRLIFPMRSVGRNILNLNSENIYIYNNRLTALQKMGVEIFKTQPFVQASIIQGNRLGIKSLLAYFSGPGKGDISARVNQENLEDMAVQLFWPGNDGFLGEPEHSYLLPGTYVDRYGYAGGTYVAPQNTPTDMRALAPGTTEKPYNIYRVVKPVHVTAGPAAPAFRTPGLGIQYKTRRTVQELLDKGFLEKVE